MEKESPGSSFSNAVSIWLQQLGNKSKHKALSKIGHPMMLLVIVVLLWSFLNRKSQDSTLKTPRIEIETSLKLEASCEGKSAIKGALISSSDIVCVLLPEVEFDCKEKKITIKSLQMSQLPLNKWSLLKHTRFVDKIPSGADSCKAIKKIYYESW